MVVSGVWATSVTRGLGLNEEVRLMWEESVMALVPLRFCVSESFCTSISWHLQPWALGQRKKVTGGAYGRLSADLTHTNRTSPR